MTPADTAALRALQEAMRREKPHYPEWIDARYVLSAALLYAADDLLDEIDKLREDNAVLSGQVARVEAWYGWRRGTDVLEAIAIPTEGEYVGTGLKPGMKYYASVNGGEPQEYTSGQALAAPAERTGVSRESIEQVRWAEANPNAVALDEVEAKRRDTAEGGE